MSESVAVLDAKRLKPIIESSCEKLVPIAADTRLKDIQHTLTLMDSTIVEALPRIAMASFRETQLGSGKKLKWTRHTHVEVDRSIPTKIEVTPTGGGSGYVCRIRDISLFQVLEETPLTDADRAARVVSDQVISLGSENARSRPNHPMRLIFIKAEPHKSKGRPGKGSTGQNCDGFLRIVTILPDVPAEIIAILFQYRWTIELCFRYFKHLLGCRHLLSRPQNGIKLQLYCAIIACMLISLWTGRKPTLRTHEMICRTSAAWPARKNCWHIWRDCRRLPSLEARSSEFAGHSVCVVSPASRCAHPTPA